MKADPLVKHLFAVIAQASCHRRCQSHKSVSRKRIFGSKMSNSTTKRCSKCQAVNSLALIVSRAKDGNYYTCANGDEGEGYLPSVKGLSDSDGLVIRICIACGQIQELDLVGLREKFQRREYE